MAGHNHGRHFVSNVCKLDVLAGCRSVNRCRFLKCYA